MSLSFDLPDATLAGRVATGRRSRGAILDIVLVNNMPDSALLATERQFCSAVSAALGKNGARFHLTTLPGISRGVEARQHIAANYVTLETVLQSTYDAAIVTGNEPQALRLDAEPYWPDLARVIDWADGGVQSSLWSCLAAHAAVWHLHGIERRPLPAKMSGIYACRSCASDDLLDGFASDTAVPHSRLNGLRREELLAHGYVILRESDEAGVDLFSLDKNSRFVFLQGHPEYDTDTLAREYRRDVGRFLRGEREHYPKIP